MVVNEYYLENGI